MRFFLGIAIMILMELAMTLAIVGVVYFPIVWFGLETSALAFLLLIFGTRVWWSYLDIMDLISEREDKE